MLRLSMQSAAVEAVYRIVFGLPVIRPGLMPGVEIASYKPTTRELFHLIGTHHSSRQVDLV
jgi:hypothetical protein